MKKNSIKTMLTMIASVLIVFGIIFLFPIKIVEDIKFVFAEVLLNLGSGLLGFLLGAKLKEKISFKKVTISFAVIFCIFSVIKLFTYNITGDECKSILSSLLSFASAVWFSNICPEEI